MAHRQRKSYRKMAASLSALGAGALLAGGSAEASIIYSGPVNVDVGFAPGAVDHYNSGPLGPFSATFSFLKSTYKGSNIRSIIGTGCGCVNFATQTLQQLGFSRRSFLKLFDAGAKWSTQVTGTHYYPFVYVGTRLWGSTIRGSGTPYTVHSTAGVGPFSDKYALFRIGEGSDTLYGWLHLSFSITDAFGADATLGPDLTILGWAYDDSGAQLAAGQTTAPDTATPEPASAVSTGLAALAMGAVGLRKWRSARKPA
uniref:PEP-CTERM protein-sorting domain-containing protein n=1 Tax=Solibacter usitatus (strain Ellin6076) TaxID=234267 RepID=Q027P8_SOLUE